MKRTLLLVCIVMLSVYLYGQKPVIDSELSGVSWPTVGGGVLSPDGRYVAYTIIGVPKGGSTLVLRDVKGGWQKEVAGAGDAHMNSDSRWVVFQMGDSLWLQLLGREERRIIKEVAFYQLLGKGREQRLLYLLRAPAEELVVEDLLSGKEDHYRDVRSYIPNGQGGRLLLVRGNQLDSGRGNNLSLLDLSTGREQSVWEGGHSHGHVFAQGGSGLAFLATVKEGDVTREELWYYCRGMEKAVRLVYDGQPGIDAGLTVLAETQLVFNRGGDRLYFYLTRRRKALPAAGVQVDIWHYKDQPLQSEQLKAGDPASLYLVAVAVGSKRVIQLQQDGENVFFQQNGVPGETVVVSVLTDSLAWQRDGRSYNVYAVSAIDGSRRLMGEHLPCQSFNHEFRFSPGGRWILWFNRCRKMWYSYDWKEGINRPVSESIPYPIYNECAYEFAEHYPYYFMFEVGIGGWLDGDRQVLLYDDYDIWQVDLAGAAAPVCVTGGYGRQHSVKLRIAWDNDHRGDDEGMRVIKEGDSLLLSGFNSRTMENGFYGLRLGGLRFPASLSMLPDILYADDSQLDNADALRSVFLQKSSGAPVWLLQRQSELEAPNLYTTEDFKSFRAMSDVQPHRSYNWLTTELLRWTTLSGQEGRGILYKPENFDPSKKYPVLFNYYEQQSSGLHHYPVPTLCRAKIDVAYFVSRGYLVCIPDIHYRIGHPGEGVVDAVVSAARYLSHRAYVDSLHLGIQGHSFGGFEINYLVTHTNLFAAAAESAGATDLISFYGRLSFGLNGYGKSLHYYYEVAQGRMGATLWERPDLYSENSAIFRADKVTTPLLMVHNKGDALVPFMQGVELFTALRRLGKRVWMLQYDGAGHGISQDDDSRDYTQRLLQFFDHYLKGAPAPVWMMEGIPASDKEKRSGYELDKNGRRP